MALPEQLLNQRPTSNRITPEQEFGAVSDIPVPEADLSNSLLANPIPEIPQQKGSKYDLTDAPVPGESLTGEPGGAPWERPPQFSDPQKAAAYVWKQLNKPANMKQMLTMLDQGMPVEALARTVLMGGFQEGKWTPDVALLISRPVVTMISTLGYMADVTGMKLGMKERSSDKPVKDMVMANYKSKPEKYQEAYQSMKQKAPQEVKDAKALSRGLMSRPRKESA